MASASSRLKQNIDEITECPICQDECTNPKLLPCVHTFCLKCIQQYVNGKRVGDVMPCPVCRKSFIIPQGGITQLPLNFYISKLIECRKLSQGTFNGAMCDICTVEKEKDPDKMAKWQCVNCSERLCVQCHRVHQKQRATKSHIIIELGNKETEHLLQCRPSFCDRHIDEQIKLHCRDCKKVVCMMCYALEHKNHACGDINVIVKEFHIQLQQNIAEAINKFRIISNTAVLQRKERDKFMSILQELDQIKLTTFQQFEMIEDEIGEQLVTLNSFLMHFFEVKDKATALEICMVHADEFNGRAAEIHALKPIGIFHSPVVAFSPSNTTKKNQQTSNVASVTTGLSNSSAEVQSQSKHTGRSKLTHTIPGSQVVYGVTVLFAELFVLCRGTPAISHGNHPEWNQTLEVYCTTPHITPCGTLKLDTPNAMVSPSDLASSEEFNCLYIADKGREDCNDSCVHRVVLRQLMGEMTKWPLDNMPHGLSATPDGQNVVITFPVAHRVREYTTHGVLVRDISLQDDMVNPLHAIKLNSVQFVVCHGGPLDPLNRICIVRTDGRIVRSYGASPGSGVGQLNGPVRLTVDKNGSVIVADVNNKRVIQVDSSLNCAQELVSRDFIKPGKPLRLCLDETRGYLHIVSCDNVLVFKLI